MFWIAGGLVLLVVIAILLRLRLIVVPQEERLVIYWLGRFRRLAGPGLTYLLGSLETVERTVRVRNEPASYTVQGLFIYDIPFGFTLNFWRRFDLQTTAGGDRDRLADLAQFDDAERERYSLVKIRDALVHSVTQVQQQRPLPSAPTVLDRLLPIVPGLPDCERILAGVQQELLQTLPTIGVIMDAAHPVIIERLHLSQDLLDGFSRNRVTELLRQRYPNLPEDAMIQVITSIEGANPLNVGRFSLQGDEAQSVRPEFRFGKDGPEPRVKTAPSHREADTEAGSTKGKKEGSNGPPHLAPDGELSARDLSVLKTVPRPNPNRHSDRQQAT